MVINSQYVFKTDPDGVAYGDRIYAGNEYRSVIFDVAHYRPFRFAAQVRVADDAFVAFVRLRTNARIGVVTLNIHTGGPGDFELNLRDEYSFNWKDNPIDLYFTDNTNGNKVYNFNYTDNGVEKPVDQNLLYTVPATLRPPIWHFGGQKVF